MVASLSWLVVAKVVIEVVVGCWSVCSGSVRFICNSAVSRMEVPGAGPMKALSLL